MITKRGKDNAQNLSETKQRPAVVVIVIFTHAGVVTMLLPWLWRTKETTRGRSSRGERPRHAGLASSYLPFYHSALDVESNRQCMLYSE